MKPASDDSGCLEILFAGIGRPISAQDLSGENRQGKNVRFSALMSRTMNSGWGKTAGTELSLLTSRLSREPAGLEKKKGRQLMTSVPARRSGHLKATYLSQKRLPQKQRKELASKLFISYDRF
jgi:hypothetical protein